MIGIIEKIIVDCLLVVGDDETRLDVFFDAGIPPDRVYRLDRHYPDEETARLIVSSLKITGLNTQAFFDLFTVMFFDVLEDVFPEFLRMSKTSADLVRKQAKIHALMAAGSRKPGESEKSTDKFQMLEKGPHEVVVRYKSELQLCGLYETIVRAAAERYGDTVVFADHECVSHGADACVMTMQWTSIAGQPTEFYEGEDLTTQRRAQDG